MLGRLFPWKFIIRHITRSYGLIDPFMFLARLRRFSQPSAVQTPIELLRAGIVFHARGLINTNVIQNNLDWVWPFWVKKQFNPRDPSFIPRAYSLTHVNLTNRNWTAVGEPYLPLYPIVDPRGLVTPLYDGWSLDFWMVSENVHLLPSKLSKVEQSFIDPDLTIQTGGSDNGLSLTVSVHMAVRDQQPFLDIRVAGFSDQKNSRIVVSLRPYNPEGIQFIEKIDYDRELNSWKVNSKTHITMNKKPEKVLFSNYETGDVFHQLLQDETVDHITCDAGMATAAALFPLEMNRINEVEFTIPLEDELSRELERPLRPRRSWETVLKDMPRLTVPDKKIESLYDGAKKTLVLLSADDVYPGPYTYRRFWFRDACLMIHALLSLGLNEWCIRLLDHFFGRQKGSGYFQSQEGEWDSNGQVLWIFDRFHQLAGEQKFLKKWLKPLFKGAMWIKNKRTPKNQDGHGGLLPAGFSAEHFGPNDYYYWDDFWGLAGLRSAARLAGVYGYYKKQKAFSAEAEDFEQTIFNSIASIPKEKTRGGIPASPYRRMDSGAIGSLAADYPLQITQPGNPLIAGTVNFLMENCVQSGCFFQDMIHSGMNPYLTMCLAQSLLRMGDSRYQMLIKETASLASATGQWPEAVHPFTGGGCMGDGQHGWAAAEWVLMLGHLFVREEKEQLVLGSGIFQEWIDSGNEISFSEAPTSFGNISMRISREDNKLFLDIHTRWHGTPPVIEIRVPGYLPSRVVGGDGRYELVPV